ncbi:MAG: cytochrome C [Acidobacteria bacterium]|nr:cytochrome C [Acidobacteriota bacterium]
MVARAHPDVGAGDCADCHRATHPPVVADYESSKHGRGLVGCPVCHGSTQAGFVAKPGPERCQPCHAAQVDSLKTPVMKNKDCWSCHVPHRLNPHMALHKNDPNGGAK